MLSEMFNLTYLIDDTHSRNRLLYNSEFSGSFLVTRRDDVSHD